VCQDQHEDTDREQEHEPQQVGADRHEVIALAEHQQ
jgi:hypothetical protein